MTGWTFIRRGLAHFRSSYVGVLVGSLLGALVLLGALFAGDSVEATLRRAAEARVGQAEFIFTGGDRFFRDGLAEQSGAAPVLLLKGQATLQGSGRGTGGVQVLGVDDRFWELAPDPGSAGTPGARQVAVNEELARQLGAEAGDTVILRFQKPGLFSRDAPMSGEAEEPLVMRGEVDAVLGRGAYGSFQLEATQLPVATVFVPLSRLQELIEQPGRVNVLLLGDGTADGLAADIRSDMTLQDYGLKLVDVPADGSNAGREVSSRPPNGGSEETGSGSGEPGSESGTGPDRRPRRGLPAGGWTEIRSERIFLDRHVEEVAEAGFLGVQPVLTYLATTIAANDRETPYSMVGAVDRAAAPFLPVEELGQDGIVLNSWEAEDLQAKVGDAVRVDYFRVAEGNQLVEASAEFVVKGVVPLEGLAADKAWMPDFPGMAEADDSSEWSPGLPLDLGRIRDKDETYWDDHKGVPKAFISLARGQELWSNRWGDATALRVPAETASLEVIRDYLLATLDPAEVGLVVRDFRSAGLAAATSPTDIGVLFLSMGFFLIVAAVTLVALLFRFNVELRNRESGLLAAVGVPPKKVMRWRMWEALVVVVAGSLLAIPLAIDYSEGILRFIETIWNADGGEAFFAFHANPASVAAGLGGFILFAMAAVWLVARKQAKRKVSLRLEAGTEEEAARSTGRSLGAAVACAVLGVGAIAAAGAMGPQGAFFTAGFLILLAGLFLFRWRLGKVAPEKLDVKALARLNAARRPTRSLAVAGILASGVFLVVAVAAFRKSTTDDWTQKDSGTGGYALWVETAGPINRVGDGAEAIDYFELGDDRDIIGAVLPFRRGAGDDASCFNLNTVTRPRLLGTDTSVLAEREAFEITKTAEGLEKSWEVLQEGEALRAFVDQTTLMWVLKLPVGARITYEDEFGEPFEVEIAGTLADSVFQGNFVVDEKRLLERYPSQAGYGLFLAEANGEVEEARAAVQKSLADRGVEAGTTIGRLEAFHGVENTYIAIFHVLGGLGVILGAAGLGLVTVRNLVERRNEFAVMQILGLPRRVLRQLVFREIRQFLLWGLGIGLAAALVAIIPNFAQVDPAVALGWVAGLVVLVALNAWFWSWIGYRRMIGKVSEVKVV